MLRFVSQSSRPGETGCRMCGGSIMRMMMGGRKGQRDESAAFEMIARIRRMTHPIKPNRSLNTIFTS